MVSALGENGPAGIQAANISPHVLVVNLGLGQEKYAPLGYATTEYLMPDGRIYSTALAGFALWKWLEETGRPPKAVVFACTEEAWKQREQVVKEHARQLGLDAQRIEAPIFLVLPQSLEDVWAMIAPLESWLMAKGDEGTSVLHVDLTHAYRAIPLAHLLIVLYLQERGLIQVGVCGYGAFREGSQKTPYLDLSHLLHLARWAQAVRSFRERFDTAGLALLLEHYEKEARDEIALSGFIPPIEVRRVINAARLAGPYFAAGLPLELGIEVRKALGNTTRENLEKAAEQLIPAHRNLVLDLFEILQPLTVEKVAKRGPKAAMVLNKEELERQVRLLNLWVQAGLPERAFLVLREAIINRLCLAWCPEKWLDKNAREEVEVVLNEVFWSEPPLFPLTPELQTLRSVWREMANRRNSLAHAGMQKNNVDVGELTSAVKKLMASFQTLIEVDKPWDQLAQHLTVVQKGKHDDSATSS